MSARNIAIIAHALLIGCAPVALPTTGLVNAGGELAAACKGRDGWNDPAPPARLFGNTYYVGTCGITALLVTSPQGHVLVDGGTDKAAALVAANIEKLGFSLRDVRWILPGHEHFDHAGAFAELKRVTGARLAALPAAARVLESGKPHPADPQAGHLPAMEPVAVDRLLKDGETLMSGPLRFTARATPAHSPGSTSWTWRACEGRRCTIVTYADSASTISTPAYRFSDHPERMAAVRLGLDALAQLPCGLLITPHPSASGLFERLAAGDWGPKTQCTDYAATARARFEERLATETNAREADERKANGK